VLLTATVRRLAASPVNQALEVPELRALVGGGHGHTQMILRIGYGDPVPETPRRTLSEILDPGYTLA
ncbi:nitroreductase, partial [Plantactinospora sp. B6F1]